MYRDKKFRADVLRSVTLTALLILLVLVVVARATCEEASATETDPPNTAESVRASPTSEERIEVLRGLYPNSYIELTAWVEQAENPWEPEDIQPTTPIEEILALEVLMAESIASETDEELSISDETESAAGVMGALGAAESIESEPKRYGDFYEGQIIAGSLTYYDVCVLCCGSTEGITASGVKIQNGMEDPHIASCNWLPLGTIVTLNGAEYIIADRGGRGLDAVGRVDVFTPEGHQAALNLGRKDNAEIVIISLP